MGRTGGRYRCSSPVRPDVPSPARTGRFLPSSTRERYAMLEWLMFQMGGIGPMLGQTHHFRVYAPAKAALRDRPIHERGQAPCTA